MKKNIIYSLLLVVAVLFAGCEDRLDIAKHGNMGGQDDFYKTNEQTEQAVAAMYSRVKGLYFTWFFTKNLLSDDAWCGGGNRGDNNSHEQMNEYTFDSSNSNIEGLFSGLYGVIYQSNLVIEKVANDTEVKKRAIAEAYFFRAWANFELVTLWGTAPLVDHLLATDEYRQPNSTPEALWAVVEADLKGYRYECLAFQEEQGRSGDGYACYPGSGKGLFGQGLSLPEEVSGGCIRTQ